MARPTTEGQLFDWESWDELGPHDFSFENVTLVTKIGDFEVGTRFNMAFAIHSNSLLILEDDKGVQTGFDLKLSAGDKVDLATVQLECNECDCGHEHNHT